jgi:hypothetical protein
LCLLSLHSPHSWGICDWEGWTGAVGSLTHGTFLDQPGDYAPWGNRTDSGYTISGWKVSETMCFTPYCSVQRYDTVQSGIWFIIW